MLFAGFIGSACWSMKNLLTPYPVHFGSIALSLISLVSGNEFTPLQALIASLKPGGDCSTYGVEFESSRILTLTYMVIQLSRLYPLWSILQTFTDLSL